MSEDVAQLKQTIKELQDQLDEAKADNSFDELKSTIGICYCFPHI